MLAAAGLASPCTEAAALSSTALASAEGQIYLCCNWPVPCSHCQPLVIEQGTLVSHNCSKHVQCCEGVVHQVRYRSQGLTRAMTEMEQVWRTSVKQGAKGVRSRSDGTSAEASLRLSASLQKSLHPGPGPVAAGPVGSWLHMGRGSCGRLAHMEHSQLPVEAG